jgi:putative transposase
MIQKGQLLRGHHPPHLFLEENWYMISAHTIGEQFLLHSREAKILVQETLKQLIMRFEIKLRAWVVLDNHYHLLLKPPSEEIILPRFIGQLHGSTAFQLNQLEHRPKRQVWHNYWDTCTRTDKDFWTRFNYIHNNPVKHGYVKRPEDWEFSSYHYYLRTKGQEWLQDMFLSYPIIDFSDGRDSFDI